VALGELTKQLAGQAMRAKDVKEVIDALRPPDLSRITDTLRGTKPTAPPPAAAEDVCAVMLGQVQAMQRALKEDEELLVLCNAGVETLRVLEVFVPSPNVVVLTGIDTNRTVTRVVSHIESVQLVCKAVKVQPPAKPVRINFIVPKPKSE